MQEQKRFWERHLNYSFYFLALAALGEQVGFYFSPLNKIWGSLFLLLYLLSVYKGPGIKPANFKQTAGFFWILGIFILVIISPLAAISAGLVLLIPLSLKQPERKIEFRAGLIFYFYLLFHSFVPQFFLLERAVADLFNNIIKTVTTLQIQFYPYTYGFGVLVILVGFIIIQASQSRESLRKKLILITITTLGYLLLQSLYFLLSMPFWNAVPFMDNGWSRLWYSLIRPLFPMNGQGLIFLISFISMTLIEYLTANWNGIQTKKEQLPDFKNNRPKLLATVLLGLILFSFYWNLDIFEPAARVPDIYVYDTGMDFNTLPNDNKYGMNIGMYAMIFKYFQDWGHDIKLASNLENLKPENNDILVLFNPSEKMRPLDLKQLKNFIANGGRLLVFGDHTYMFGLTNRYYDFLDALGISFNFDTAMPLRQAWRRCLRSPFQTWDLMIRKDNFTTGIALGASLTVRCPAVPLIIGQYGWSDTGNIVNEPVYFGDRSLTPGEPTGDLILAAERDYGKGKILVFSDSTFMQNTPISNAYPLVRLCLSHLQPKNQLLLRLALPGIYLLGLLLLLLFRKEVLKTHSYCYIIIPFLLLIWLGSIIGREQAYFRIPSRAIQRNAGIDFTTYPGFFYRDWEESNRGTGGLKNNLCRIETIPYLVYQHDYDELKKLDYFIIMAPKIKISRARTNELIEYVKEGGALICACGFEEREQVSELLAALDLDIMNIPLSFLSGNDTNLNIRFVSAWPIKVMNKNAGVIGVAFEKYPVIVESAVGKGKILLISDPHFFENRNLEGNKVFYKNNTEFVKEILTDLNAKLRSK